VFALSQTAGESPDAHAEVESGLGCPHDYSVMQPCVPISHALIHLLCGQQDSWSKGPALLQLPQPSAVPSPAQQTFASNDGEQHGQL